MPLSDLTNRSISAQRSGVGNTYNFNKPKYYCSITILDETLNPNPEEAQIEVIPFQFMPGQILDSKTANYNDMSIIARSAPIKSYQGSSSRIITFTLEFFAKPDMEDIDYTPEKIKTIVDKLRALTYPQYYNNFILPPKKCIVRIGKQLSMLGVLKTINVTYRGDYPWTVREFNVGTDYSSVIPIIDGNGIISTIDRNKFLDKSLEDCLAFYANVQLSFEEFSPIPLSYHEIAAGMDYEFMPRGDVSTSTNSSNIG